MPFDVRCRRSTARCLINSFQISRVTDQTKRRLVTTSESVEDCYDILFRVTDQTKRRLVTTSESVEDCYDILLGVGLKRYHIHMDDISKEVSVK
ncbi:hypothetical protein Syun_028422 [Stephania yunnanensis]|uniref:Uncharacterized protein n=1 Tax=Stephania yunnanensis TaxID=152371 RepID=A0AAP0HR39_9MAGN